MSMDWENWVFYEGSTAKASCAPESLSSSVFESSAASLDFDNFLSVPHSTGESYFENEESLDQRSIQLKLHEISASCATMSDNEQLAYHQLSRNMEMVHILSIKLDVFCPLFVPPRICGLIIRVFVSIVAVILFMTPFLLINTGRTKEETILDSSLGILVAGVTWVLCCRVGLWRRG